MRQKHPKLLFNGGFKVTVLNTSIKNYEHIKTVAKYTVYPKLEVSQRSLGCLHFINLNDISNYYVYTLYNNVYIILFLNQFNIIHLPGKKLL